MEHIFLTSQRHLHETDYWCENLYALEFNICYWVKLKLVFTGIRCIPWMIPTLQLSSLLLELVTTVLQFVDLWRGFENWQFYAPGTHNFVLDLDKLSLDQHAYFWLSADLYHLFSTSEQSYRKDLQTTSTLTVTMFIWNCFNITRKLGSYNKADNQLIKSQWRLKVKVIWHDCLHCINLQKSVNKIHTINPLELVEIPCPWQLVILYENKFKPFCTVN